MDEIFERMCGVVKQRTGQEPDEALRPLFSELWALRDSDTPAHRARLASAGATGAHYLGRGQPSSQAVREVLALGRALVDEAIARGLDDAGARRLGELTDEAATQVSAAIEDAGRSLRQSWLSYLVHEVKNPLNTILNALWLLREKGSDPTQAARFIDLAERAVKRLEGRARDVRQLDEQLLTPPPGWLEMRGGERAPRTL